MLIDDKNWYFLKNYSRLYSKGDSVRVTQFSKFCRKTDYEILLLVSHEVLEDLRHEPVVLGFSVSSSIRRPYPVFVVGINTDNIQSLIDKYDVEAILSQTPQKIKC